MKVLIVSYNPLTLSNNGGKYFISLFSNFAQNELMQLYVHDSMPDKLRCESYYQLTDRDLLQVLSGRKKQHIINSLNFNEKRTTDVLTSHLNVNKHRYIKLLFRDLLWTVSPWETKELDDWIKTGKPDCILSDTGDSCFLYNVAMKLSSKYKIPLIGSFGDDYVSIPTKWTEPVKKLQLTLLRRKITQFVHYCDKVFTLNDTFTRYYQSIFAADNPSKIKSIYMGESLNFETTKYKILSSSNVNLKFSYIGNLSYGRGDNLLEIGKALDKFNSKYNMNHKLLLYAKVTDIFSNKCKQIKSIVLKGFIPGEKVAYAILDSDVLIHTESFLNENIQNTLYSVSTKIADSVASKRCILAYGPSEIASMQHLINNDCAYTITSKEQLYTKISALLLDVGLINEYAHKTERVYNMYHNSLTNSRYFRKMIEDCISDVSV